MSSRRLLRAIEMECVPRSTSSTAMATVESVSDFYHDSLDKCVVAERVNRVQRFVTEPAFNCFMAQTDPASSKKVQLWAPQFAQVMTVASSWKRRASLYGPSLPSNPISP